MLRRTLLLALLISPTAYADYFLDGSQQLDLLAHGQMDGHDGNRYDIWIVPGYMNAVTGVQQGWTAAGEDVASYAQSSTYGNAYDHGKSVFQFGNRDVLHDFALKGSADTWRDAFAAADTRTQKQVFGWWFAYPWALIESTGISAVRLGLGIPVGLGIAVAGAPATSALELTFPALKSVYHATIPGTVVPVISGSWNTVVAPPLALLGQQPSRERVDGFWMKLADTSASDPDLAAADQALTQLRQQLALDPAIQHIDAQKKTLEADYARQRKEALEKLQHDYATNRQALDSARIAAIKSQLGNTADTKGTPLDTQKLKALVHRYGRPRVLQMLAGKEFSSQETDLILSQLLPNEPLEPSSPAPLRSDSDKTNPVKRSLDLESHQY